MRQGVKNVAIRAIATCVPETLVNNADLGSFSTEEINKIVSSTGVEKRKVSSNICASDLCLVAARKLFAEVSCDPKSIDILIFVSQTPDYRLSATTFHI